MKHHGIIAALLLIGAGAALAQGQPPDRPPKRTGAEPAPQQPAGGGYSIEQAVSDKAQLNTLAFSGLAFMTGTLGADTFLPPGKVADYFGFQYMRDIDASEAGHNMMFLTNIGNNILSILSPQQKALLLALAKEQESLYRTLAEKRLVLIKAFRQNLEGTLPAGYRGLSEEAVKGYVADIFEIDGTLSFRRAETYGAIAKTLAPGQAAAIGKLAFNDSSTWPELPDQLDKRSMTHDQDVLCMTYASEFFSWYAGSSDADVYFCPERHATYFGGFYMKDYPAMGNREYFIPTALTGDSGESFLAILNEGQRGEITGIMDLLRPILTEILSVRRAISTEFRKYLAGATADRLTVLRLSRRYGELDGGLSWLCATRFASVYKTLSKTQKDALVKLRNQDVFPRGVYMYADPIETPVIPDTTFLCTKQ